MGEGNAAPVLAPAVELSATSPSDEGSDSDGDRDEGTNCGAWLGRNEAELRAEFGDALKLQPIVARRVLNPAQVKMPSPDAARPVAPKDDEVPPVEPALDAEVKDPFSGQQRLTRKPKTGEVQLVEYELFQGRIYRVRWRLAERFERPLMSSLVPHVSTELGKPYYDQRILGKIGTGRATLRRAGWRDGFRSLEIRQLNPRVGGPLFVTLSDQSIVRKIGEFGGTAAPEPDSIGAWWEKPIKPFEPLVNPELKALLAAFDGVLGGVGWVGAGGDGDSR